MVVVIELRNCFKVYYNQRRANRTYKQLARRLLSRLASKITLSKLGTKVKSHSKLYPLMWPHKITTVKMQCLLSSWLIRLFLYHLRSREASWKRPHQLLKITQFRLSSNSTKKYKITKINKMTFKKQSKLASLNTTPSKMMTWWFRQVRRTKQTMNNKFRIQCSKERFNSCLKRSKTNK